MPSTETIVGANVARVQAEIAAACTRVGRRADEVTLIGVTKSVDRSVADVLIGAGVHDIAENRVQDAVAKFGRKSDFPPLAPEVRLHMIGNLQTNKVRDVLDLFTSVQSLNREGLADALEREASRRGRTIDVLLEVNVAEDVSKQGAFLDMAIYLMGYVITKCPAIRIQGLMTIAPQVDEMFDARPAFRGLRELRDSLREKFPSLPLPVLSMGMSNDFPIAIEEGATHVRIGRALFTGLPSPD
ncbi:MAG: YggS family pyridoxal phosphate-dependent enzyme [Thermomicrobiales bacterium]